MTKARARGKFITLEGVEGVGKSTQLAFVVARLRSAGLSVVATREPGGTPLAEEIRGLLLDTAPGTVPPTTELLLMFAARAAHLHAVIEPALTAGQWVVCDRFTDATYAYQGGGRGLDRSLIASLEQAVQGNLRPDLTLLLDAPFEVLDARRAERGVHDRFEQEAAEFFRRVQAEYRAIAAREPDRVRLIDASADLATVEGSVAAVLDHWNKKIL